MIKANFNAYDSYVTDSLYQWDLNQVLNVTGLNLSVAPEVHFSNAKMDKSIVKQATIVNHVVSVPIPNSLLQDPLSIYAHIGIYDGDTFKVVEKVEIPVIPKERPSDYQIQDSDEEIYSFNQVLNALANKADSAVINARVDQIIAHNNSMAGNSELVDIRTGSDGTIYGSAGTAVRTQIKSLKNKMIELPYAMGTTKVVKFDTVNKTVSFVTSLRMSGKGYEDLRPSIALNWNVVNGVGAHRYVIMSENGEYSIEATNTLPEEYTILFSFLPEQLPYFRGCTLPPELYVVDEKEYSDYILSRHKNDYSNIGFLCTDNVVNFDTVNKQVTITTDARLQGFKQLDLNKYSTTLKWDMSGSATNYVVIRNGALISTSARPLETDIYLFAFYKIPANLKRFVACTLPVNMYTVDGLFYSDKDKIIFTENSNEPLYINKNKKIYGNGCELNLGTKLEGNKDGTITTVEYTPESNSHFYKTFVTKKESLLIDTVSRPYYNVTIWAFNGNKYEAIRLTPYLTLEEVGANDNSFTYADGVITINSANYNEFVLAGEISEGIVITEGANVEIHDLKILFARNDNVVVSNGNVTFKNCEFGYATTGNGLKAKNANCDMVACKAYYNRNDGFNYHDSGHSTLLECEGYNNFDDGVSHHELCTYEINGGLWLNNYKGGIASPTYEALGRVNNAICMGNHYGIMAYANDPQNENIYVNGVVLKDNDIGLLATNYNVIISNSKIVDNAVNTKVEESGVITEL